MPSVLKISSVALAMGAFLAVAAVLLLVDLPYGSLFWSAVQNSGHSLVFALLTFTCLLLLVRFDPRPTSRHFTVLVAAVAVFGCSVEVLQGFIGREASLYDILLNLVGIAVGVMLFIAFTAHGIALYKRAALFAIAASILLACFTNPIRYAISAALQPDLPVLADFEYFSASNKVSALRAATTKLVKQPEDWPANQSRVLRVRFGPGKWPGVSFLQPHRDWSGYETFSFQVFNPTDQAIEVVLRVHDYFHNNTRSDRFRRRLTIPPGQSDIVIPIDHIRRLDRDNQSPRRVAMDMTKIKGIIIFASSGSQDAVLYFDNLLLQ